MTEVLKLQGRVFVQFELRAVTGLHIGGLETGIEIGGVDKTVIRNPIDNQPFIPGSSLRGKMRSLTEKYLGLPQNRAISKVRIHSCKDQEDYKKCPVCRIYGVPAEEGFSTPTRLIVRDTFLKPESVRTLLQEAQTDLPFTEVKSEVTIDRVTSMATPRQMERVPAGAIFAPAQLIYSVYAGLECDPDQDVNGLDTVFLGLKLLEDDYLGGLGSRGSGQVHMEQVQVGYKSNGNYGAEPTWLTDGPLADLAELDRQQAALLEALKNAFGIG